MKKFYIEKSQLKLSMLHLDSFSLNLYSVILIAMKDIPDVFDWPIKSYMKQNYY